MALQISRGDRYPVPQSPSNVTPVSPGFPGNTMFWTRGRTSQVRSPFLVSRVKGKAEAS